MDGEKFLEEQRDGFEVVAEWVPDEDARSGEDDVTPTLQGIGWGEYYELRDTERDEFGQFLPKAVCGVDCYGNPWKVDEEEIDRLARAGWDKPADARIRSIIREQAEGYASGAWYYVGVIVHARRNGASAEASLWGIDYHDGDADSDRYLHEVAGDLVGEAIDQAARQLLDGLAPLALSY